MRRPVPILRSAPNILSGLRLLAAPFAAWMILNDHDTAALLVFVGLVFAVSILRLSGHGLAN